MGCGSSSQVLPSDESGSREGPKVGNGVDHGKDPGRKDDEDGDDLSTVILPDSPDRPMKKMPIAFEIPLDQDTSSRRKSPPAHLQRLLNQPQVGISRDIIEEKLAEAETRRLMILQQRAASAQRRSQKMMKSFHDMDHVDSSDERDLPEPETEMVKLPGTNSVHIPTESRINEGKNI